MMMVPEINLSLAADILEKIGHFTEADLERFIERVKQRKVSKDEVLLQEGQVCQTLFYNLQGALYQYNYTEELEIRILDLHLEHEWVINDRSFLNQKPSEYCLKAFSDCEIIELSLQDLHRLIAESPAFLQMGRILEQATARVHFFDNPLSPTEKYLHILEHRPGLLQQFPLKIIAAYLKITPETLSRVRDKLAKGDRS